jgi:hypothetical protein
MFSFYAIQNYVLSLPSTKLNATRIVLNFNAILLIANVTGYSEQQFSFRLRM